MTAVLAFVIANKALLAALGVAILSEALPFLPGKAQGLAHGLIGLLKKVPADGAK